MAPTLAVGAYRRVVERAHESLSTAALPLVPPGGGSPATGSRTGPRSPRVIPAGTADNESLRADLQGLRREVRESWLRSLSGFTAPRLLGETDPATLSDADLTEARREQRIAAALPIVRCMLVEPAAEAGLVVAIGNEHGHLLWVEGDRTALNRAEAMGFVPGADWSESSMGTSAPGVVLATGSAMQVSGAEHLSHRVHPWNCSAAPLTDPVTGRLVGVIDLTGGDDAVSPLALPLLQSTADAVHGAWRDLPAPAHATTGTSFPTTAPSPPPSASPAPDGPAAPAATAPHRHAAAGLLRVTGHLRPMLDGVELTGRHAEILTLLAWHGTGLTGAELEAELYPEEGFVVGKRRAVAEGSRPATADGAARAISLRAEVHRLRRTLQNADAPVELLSRPYRLAGHVHVDALCARDALRDGDLDRALHAAAGPVLPRSESPGIEAIRAELGEGLREAVAQDADAEQLWAYLARPEAHDDVELWGAALKLLPADSPRRALAVSTLERLEREIG